MVGVVHKSGQLLGRSDACCNPAPSTSTTKSHTHAITLIGTNRHSCAKPAIGLELAHTQVNSHKVTCNFLLLVTLPACGDAAAETLS